MAAIALSHRCERGVKCEMLKARLACRGLRLCAGDLLLPAGLRLRTRRGMQTMKYAETGFNLEIDLSTGRIEKVATGPARHRAVSRRAGDRRQDPVRAGSARGRPVLAGQPADLQHRPAERHAGAGRQPHGGEHVLAADQPDVAFAVRRLLRAGTEIRRLRPHHHQAARRRTWSTCTSTTTRWRSATPRTCAAKAPPKRRTC